MWPIRVRLTLIYSGLLFLALVLSGAGVVTLMRERMTARVDEALTQRVQALERFLIRETTPETASIIPDEIAEYAFTQPEGHYLHVTDDQGHLLLRRDPIPPGVLTRSHEFSLYGTRYRVTGSASLEPVNTAVSEIRFLLLWSSPLLLALIAGSGYWVSSRSLQPVDEMTQAARRISAADLSARLPLMRSHDEISRLAEAWNEMLGRLEESFLRMQRFTADAAHELRTPLAALRTTAELSLRRARENEEYRQALEQVVEIAQRMQTLSEGLLAVARAQVPQAPLKKVPVDIAQLVGELVEEMRPLLEDKGLRVVRQLRPAPAEVDADSVRRAVAVLIDNAMKYTPNGGMITVETQDRGDEAAVRVSDTGIGIPAEEIPRIYDRFYRVDASRDRQTGGFGLGLAIARQVALAHQGGLTATSEVGAGSCFTLTLPRSANGSAPGQN